MLMSLFTACEEEKFYEKDFLTNIEEKHEEENGEEADIGNIIEGAQIDCDTALNENTYATQVITVDFPAAIECEFNEEGLSLIHI